MVGFNGGVRWVETGNDVRGPGSRGRLESCSSALPTTRPTSLRRSFGGRGTRSRSAPALTNPTHATYSSTGRAHSWATPTSWSTSSAVRPATKSVGRSPPHGGLPARARGAAPLRSGTRWHARWEVRQDHETGEQVEPLGLDPRSAPPQFAGTTDVG